MITRPSLAQSFPTTIAKLFRTRAYCRHMGQQGVDVFQLPVASYLNSRVNWFNPKHPGPALTLTPTVMTVHASMPLSGIQRLVWTALKFFCLSETSASILMWSHYAYNHTGVVIPLSCIEELDSAWHAARKVRFTGDMPSLRIPTMSAKERLRCGNAAGALANGRKGSNAGTSAVAQFLFATCLVSMGRALQKTQALKLRWFAPPRMAWNEIARIQGGLPSASAIYPLHRHFLTNNRDKIR
jgi:hypothetical protein